MPIAVDLLPPHMREAEQRRKPGARLLGHDPPEVQKAHAETVMRLIDALTPETRALVHEFGWNAVKPLLGMSPRAIRLTIEQTRRNRDERYAAIDRAKALENLELEL